ncbi:MAG: hypothetical protein WBF38_01375 [Nitrosotalea sp.]
MDKTIRLKQILNFLTENPFSTIREIAYNASETKINYKIAMKLTKELVKQNKISYLFGYYYTIPTIDKEILFLMKITHNDKILRPKFQKLQYKIVKEKSFRQILEQYIALLHFQIKIKKTQAIIDEKSYSSDTAIKQIRYVLKNYLKSFKILEKFSEDDFHAYLYKYIVDKYFYDSLRYEEIKTHRRTIEERVDMLSTWLTKNDMSEITDQYGYQSNKFPRKIIQGMFHENGNPKLEQLYAATNAGRISNEDASKIFVQWILRLNVPRLKTKRDQIKFSNTIKKKYKGWDILEQGDFKSFDTSRSSVL